MSEAAKNRRSFSMAYLLAQCAPPLKLPDKQPTAYSYNGVVLPKLPEWDKTVYPYAVICGGQFIPNGVYFLYFMDRQVTLDLTYSLSGFVGVEYKCEKGGTEWEYSEEGELTTTGFPRWSNYDICYGDSFDYDGSENEPGTLYRESSEPIPVYE